MAGDWIKIVIGAGHKPEVLLMARMLNVKRREAYGILVEFWEWLDGNCVDGVVDGVVDADVDALMTCPGLSALLKLVGWVEFDTSPPRMRIVNFDRHNGQTSKNRTLRNARQSKWRNARVDAQPSTKSSTREEKRSNTPIVPLPGFDKFWSTWPTGPRKVNRKGCAEKWRRDSLEAVSELIVGHVAAMRGTEQWRDYAPTPETYLNQRRWEDGAPGAGTAPARLAL